MIESAYNSNTTYAKNDVATVAGTRYASLVDNDKGNQPDTSPTFWTLAGGSIPGIQAPGPLPSGFANPTVQGTYAPGTLMPGTTRGPDGAFTSAYGTVASGALAADGTPHIWGTLNSRVQALEQFRANLDKQFASFYAVFVPPGK